MKLLLAAFLLLPAAASAAPKAVKAEFGKEFRLGKYQRAELKGSDAAVRITGFINSPCPKGARCVWSGQAVHLELTAGGKVVPLESPDSPYRVETLKSDYKSYAVLRATKRAPAKK